jgi:hypothetical protein
MKGNGTMKILFINSDCESNELSLSAHLFEGKFSVLFGTTDNTQSTNLPIADIFSLNEDKDKLEGITIVLCCKHDNKTFMFGFVKNATVYKQSFKEHFLGNYVNIQANESDVFIFDETEFLINFSDYVYIDDSSIDESIRKTYNSGTNIKSVVLYNYVTSEFKGSPSDNTKLMIRAGKYNTCLNYLNNLVKVTKDVTSANRIKLLISIYHAILDDFTSAERILDELENKFPKGTCSLIYNNMRKVCKLFRHQKTYFAKSLVKNDMNN